MSELGQSGAHRDVRFSAAMKEARGDLDLIEAEYVAALNTVSKLHEALAFMRSCELSGEAGAAHPTVLRALEMARSKHRWRGVWATFYGCQGVYA